MCVGAEEAGEKRGRQHAQAKESEGCGSSKVDISVTGVISVFPTFCPASLQTEFTDQSVEIRFFIFICLVLF